MSVCLPPCTSPITHPGSRIGAVYLHQSAGSTEGYSEGIRVYRQCPLWGLGHVNKAYVGHLDLLGFLRQGSVLVQGLTSKPLLKLHVQHSISKTINEPQKVQSLQPAGIQLRGSSHEDLVASVKADGAETNL